MSYIPHTDVERQQMLTAIGVPTIEDLFEAIPSKYRFPKLDLPAPMSEMEVIAELQALAEANDHAQDFALFRGAGAYHHYIPAAVNHIILRGEFLTAYTPYQPEVSQGTLQAIFEYQTHDHAAYRDGRRKCQPLRRRDQPGRVGDGGAGSGAAQTQQSDPQPVHSPTVPRSHAHLSPGQRHSVRRRRKSQQYRRSGRSAGRSNGDAGGRVPEFPRPDRGFQGAGQQGSRGGRAAGVRRQPDGAGAVQKPRRTGRGHRGGRRPTAGRAVELRRPVSRLFCHQAGANSPDRRADRRRNGRSEWQTGLRDDAAPARTGHPARKSDQQHLHQSPA